MIGNLIGSASASLKAHSAGVGAAVTLLLADLNADSHVTLHQWIAVAGAYAGVGAAVHMVPNTVAAVIDDTDLTAMDALAVPSADEPDDLAGSAVVAP